MQYTPSVVDSFKVGQSWLDMRVDSIQSVPIQTDGAPFSSWVKCGLFFKMIQRGFMKGINIPIKPIKLMLRTLQNQNLQQTSILKP